MCMFLHARAVLRSVQMLTFLKCGHVLFYRRGNQSSEKLSNFPKVTQLTTARIRTHAH